MVKLRFIYLFLALVLILPHNEVVPVQALAGENSANSTFVNLYIDEVKFLGNVGDVTGPGEFRLIILAADTTGKSSGMFCPGDAPLSVRKGDTIHAPCLLAISFDESKVSDGVYITVMAVDEDKSSMPADLSYEVASAGLGKALGSAAKQGAKKLGLAITTKSTPFTFAASVLFSFLSGKLKEWIQKADIIGSQGIYLSRKDNWAADETNIITSRDGMIRITYTIVHTSSTPPNLKAPVLGSTTPTSQTPTPKYWCDDLSYVKLKVGDRAKVVWEKVNLRTAPIVPEEYYENSIAKVDKGTHLTIIGGPACAHNGTWWQVRLQNGLVGWMRERTGSAGYLIGK
ncbi:MAG: hypothetical protein IT313_12090 [Anaerolineales bacterium]|nr:hypothetical protein [Anaerolineales bacterium]